MEDLSKNIDAAIISIKRKGSLEANKVEEKALKFMKNYGMVIDHQNTLSLHSIGEAYFQRFLNNATG